MYTGSKDATVVRIAHGCESYKNIIKVGAGVACSALVVRNDTKASIGYIVDTENHAHRDANLFS